MKKAFTEGGIQAFPDFGVVDPCILTTDWSTENIAGVLSQVQDGQECFLGRKCNKYEKKYLSYMYRGVVNCVSVYQEVEAYPELLPI